MRLSSFLKIFYIAVVEYRSFAIETHKQYLLKFFKLLIGVDTRESVNEDDEYSDL